MALADVAASFLLFFSSSLLVGHDLTQQRRAVVCEPWPANLPVVLLLLLLRLPVLVVLSFWPQRKRRPVCKHKALEASKLCLRWIVPRRRRLARKKKEKEKEEKEREKEKAEGRLRSKVGQVSTRTESALTSLQRGRSIATWLVQVRPRGHCSHRWPEGTRESRPEAKQSSTSQTEALVSFWSGHEKKRRRQSFSRSVQTIQPGPELSLILKGEKRCKFYARALTRADRLVPEQERRIGR